MISLVSSLILVWKYSFLYYCTNCVKKDTNQCTRPNMKNPDKMKMNSHKQTTQLESTKNG